MGPCIAKVFSSATNKMKHYTIYFCEMLYMFQAVSPPIIRSSNCIYSIGYFVKPLLLPATVVEEMAFPLFETKYNCFRQILLKITIIKFYENPPGGNWVFIFVWTAIEYMMELAVPFSSLEKAPKNQHSSATSAYDLPTRRETNTSSRFLTAAPIKFTCTRA